MSILFLSDTHGDIDLINNILVKTSADLCIHLGDFGFFDRDFISKFTRKELEQIVRHSSYEKMDVSPMTDMQLLNFVRDSRSYGNFEDFRSGIKRFDLPVCSLYGNHDDLNVIADLDANPIPNLAVWHSPSVHFMDGFAFLALGGGLSPRCPHDASEVDSLHPESGLAQMEDLIRLSDGFSLEIPRILLTHIDPFTEPLIELLAWRCGVSATFSGHRHHARTAMLHKEDAPRLLEYLKEYQLPIEFRPNAPLTDIRLFTLSSAKRGFGKFERLGDTSKEFSFSFYNTQN